MADLTAARHADTVQLQWTMTRRTTDKLPLRGPVEARICRSLDTALCIQVGNLPFEPGAAAAFADLLPPQLSSGAPRLLTYTVQLVNRFGHSAGSSNAAYSAAGPAPVALAGFGAEVRTDGVLLHWAFAPPALAGASDLVRIERIQVSASPGARKDLGATVPSATPKIRKSPFTPHAAAREGTEGSATTEQALSVLEIARNSPGEPQPGGALGRALDLDAAFDQAYTYSAERQESLTLAGRVVVISGSSSERIPVVTRDVFPPAMPTGLVAVSVPDEKAIDLSWTPDTEPDLAGYIVYRRDLSTGGNADRITPSTVGAPAVRDGNAVAGHRYAYSVSAIDADGNESVRSVEAVEALPSP